MAYSLPTRVAAAVAVFAAIPLLSACETMTPQSGATGSVVAANAPIARMIAKGWTLPTGSDVVAAGRASQAGDHLVQPVPNSAGGARPIEVTDLAAPTGAAQLADLTLNPTFASDGDIETADILKPAQ